MAHFQSVDEYIHSFEGLPQARLIAMRKLIRNQLPQAEERISYNMPAYFVQGKLVVYFAGYKNHIGMYPGRTDSAAYNALAAQYAYGKSTARFLHAAQLPTEVIKNFIRIRLEEIGAES